MYEVTYKLYNQDSKKYRTILNYFYDQYLTDCSREWTSDGMKITHEIEFKEHLDDLSKILPGIVVSIIVRYTFRLYFPYKEEISMKDEEFMYNDPENGEVKQIYKESLEKILQNSVKVDVEKLTEDVQNKAKHSYKDYYYVSPEKKYQIEIKKLKKDVSIPTRNYYLFWNKCTKSISPEFENHVVYKFHMGYSMNIPEGLCGSVELDSILEYKGVHLITKTLPNNSDEELTISCVAPMDYEMPKNKGFSFAKVTFVRVDYPKLNIIENK